MQSTEMLADVKDWAPEWRSMLEEATNEVFSMMLNSEVGVLSGVPHPENEVTALIGLAGSLCGTFRLRCEPATASHMTAAMLGMPPEDVKDEALDGLGEICNLLAGAFKTKVGKGKDVFVLSVPTVVSGTDYSVRSLAECENLDAVFSFNGAPLWIGVSIKSGLDIKQK